MIICLKRRAIQDTVGKRYIHRRFCSPSRLQANDAFLSSKDLHNLKYACLLVVEPRCSGAHWLHLAVAVVMLASGRMIMARKS